MKLLRMKKEYVDWTVAGKKTATTRLKNKGLGQFELACGSLYKPVKTGVVIEVKRIFCWNLKMIELSFSSKIREIAKLEGFASLEEFAAVLKEINGEKLKDDTPLYTHFYEVVKRTENG